MLEQMYAKKLTQKFQITKVDSTPPYYLYINAGCP